VSCVPLRIDVDFRPGLVHAVPAMLERLAARGMQASFFVVTGSNPPVRSLARLLDADYRRRVSRLGLWRVPNLLGDGGAPMLEGAAARDVVCRIEAEGHELVVHGWDHAWWANHVWHACPDELHDQIDRAYAAVERVAGPGNRAWGSPNWRSRDDVIDALAQRDVPYFSECWGRAPFSSAGRPHLPVTDNLEPWVLKNGLAPERVDEMLDARDDGAYRLICAHDYFEGLLHPGLFDALLDGLGRRGLRAVTLSRFAATLDRSTLDPAGLECGPVEGFCGDVSRQIEVHAPVVTSAV